MVARGLVRNGVVVLAEGVHLPEGQEVMVMPTGPGASKDHGILDIAPVSLGQFIFIAHEDEDMLGEMLEGRP